MKNKKFTQEEKDILLRNPYVKSVGGVSVFFTEDFKQKAVSEYFAGKSAKQIFIDAGIDLNIIGERNAIYNLSEWRKNSVNDTGRYNKSLKQALAKIRYLEEENALLKKIQALKNSFR